MAMVVPASRWHRLITALLRLGCGLPAGRGPTRGTANSAHRVSDNANTGQHCTGRGASAAGLCVLPQLRQSPHTFDNGVHYGCSGSHTTPTRATRIDGKHYIVRCYEFRRRYCQDYWHCSTRSECSWLTRTPRSRNHASAKLAGFRLAPLRPDKIPQIRCTCLHAS